MGTRSDLESWIQANENLSTMAWYGGLFGEQSHNTERGESNAILPDRSAQCHSVTSLETARSLANGQIGGGGGGRCIPRELQRLLSLLCLWEEFVGGLYLVLWLCGLEVATRFLYCIIIHFDKFSILHMLQWWLPLTTKF